MLKKSLLLFLVFTLFSCGYEPLYIKKGPPSLKIKSIVMEGDKKINRKILPILDLKENENKETGYQLKLNSEKKTEVVSKDKIGNPSVYRTTITVNFDIFDNNKIIKSKIFLTSFTYNSNKNKFDLSQYQKGIEENLINEIIEKIFIFLRS
tara:strand:+ start:2860 stop:3312 length:453 start_codon:yes stop_codon:yes gene_type:complete